ITVHWSSVPAGVTNYELTLARETTRLVTVVSANPAGSITLNGLETQTTYTLSVVSSGDHSLYLPSNVFSTEITTTRLAQLELPDLMLTIKNGVDLVARWRPIDSANSYVVSLYSGDGEGKRIGEPALVTGTSHTLKGLSAVTEYTLGVTAQGEGFADSAQAVAMTMTGWMVLPTPTGKEINLSATTNRVTVNWSRSDVSQGLQTYFISIMPDTARVGQKVVEASANEYVFINLLPDTDYLVSVVSSKDETGLVESEAYREPIKTRQRLKLQTPILDVLEVIDDRITLSWDQIAGATAYEVKLYRGRDMTRPLQQAVVAETTHTFDMLDPATGYTIRVQAQAGGYRPSDFAITSRGTPKRKLSPPTEQDFDLTIASDRVTISWRSTPSGASTYRLSIEEGGTIEMGAISAQAGQFTFTGLKPRTLYRVSVRVSGDLERYIESEQYTFSFRTSNSERLPAPTQFTAVTGNRRSQVRAELSSVPNAERYILRLYEGANSTINLSDFIKNRVFLASQTMGFIGDLDPSKHHTLGVVARGTGYLSSVEKRENVLPPALEERFLRAQVNTTEIAVNWNSANAEFQRKYLHAEFVFSVEDSAGVEVVAEQTVDISDDRYQTSALLSGVDYRLRAKVRVTIDSVSLDSEALIVPFRTLEVLLQATKQQITWTASPNTITVFWEKTPSEVMEYSLLIGGGGIRREALRNAQDDSSFQFTHLNAGTDYALAVISKGDSRLYLPSPALLVQITTDEINQLSRPRVTLSIENNTDIVVSWPPVSSALEYQVSLYLGDGEKERTG
ncbi:MAG: fibronectin type III domain-containing protein, partial [Candidatus Oxydemutatoraceae bacterium WSBS_2016_MAG_OTU14]